MFSAAKKLEKKLKCPRKDVIMAVYNIRRLYMQI